MSSRFRRRTATRTSSRARASSGLAPAPSAHFQPLMRMTWSAGRAGLPEIRAPEAGASAPSGSGVSWSRIRAASRAAAIAGDPRSARVPSREAVRSAQRFSPPRLFRSHRSRLSRRRLRQIRGRPADHTGSARDGRTGPAPPEPPLVGGGKCTQYEAMRNEMGKKLYVGNLSFSATEAEIREVFSRHGSVRSVNVITDRETGRPRGFAFVEMEDASAAEDAMKALDGSELGGRTLRVNEAQERSGGGSRGGGGGGRGGSRY